MDPADLRTMVESLPTIEQAKGILMGYYGCSPAAAFAVLRRWSSISNVKLRDLAADLVHAATEQQPAAAGPRPPFDGVRRFIRAANLPSAGPASRR